MSPSQDLRALVRRYFDALNGHDYGALDGLVAPDLIRHNPGAPPGLAAFKQTLVVYCNGFPDLAHAVDDVLVDGDKVAVRTRTTGTHLGPFLGHSPTGRRFSAAAVTLFRIGDHLIQESWVVFDTVSMLQQLGLYTPTPPGSPPGAEAPPAPHREEQATGPRCSAPRSGRRPPGPERGLSFADVRTDPLGFLHEMVSRYGDVVRYECAGRITVLLNRPGAVKHVLHDNASNYIKEGTPDLLLLKPMLGEGLLTTEGQVWRRDRQWLQPLFTRLRVGRYGEVMARGTLEMLARWEARADPAAPLNVVQEMSRLTLEIAARALLSFDLASQSEAFGAAVEVLNESMGRARPDAPEVYQPFRAALATIRQIVWQAIFIRRLYDTGEDDLVALLLRAQRERGDADRAIADQAVTMLLAGHETTAKALGWTFALLDRHPAVSDRLIAELEDRLHGRAPASADVPLLTYTQAVIHESLRLFPPIWSLSRIAVADDQVEGYSVPAGSAVVVSPYLIHRRPDLWDRPVEFLPERFLDGEAEKASQAYRYLPFSTGPRHCVGKNFALLEMPIVLATVWARYELRLPADHSFDPEALVTLRPRHGLPMRLGARHARVSVPAGEVSK